MKRVLAAVVAVLAAWLGLVVPTVAFADGATTKATTHVYGATGTGQPTADTTERGPPVAYDRRTTYDAIDRRSHGVLSPNAATLRVGYTYNRTAQFAHVARTAATTREQVRRSAVALSSAARGCVAAKGLGGFGNPLAIVPKGASMRQLTPSSMGGSQLGVEYKWVNQHGQTIRLRAHDADGTAPPGSNAASGPTYRIQIGGRYADAEGNMYPRGVHNPKSPYYDPAAANATHIPWPEGIPLPW